MFTCQTGKKISYRFLRISIQQTEPVILTICLFKPCLVLEVVSTRQATLVTQGFNSLKVGRLENNLMKVFA